MHAMVIEKPHYFCHGCDNWYPYAAPMTEEYICCDTEAGTPMDDVCTSEREKCHDGYPHSPNPCIDPDYGCYREVWQCGECEEIHGDFADAVDCCK